jgi:tetratricopeptide (TPR) repeat protein
MRDTRLLADALTRLGTTLLEVQPDEAIGFYDRALALFTQIGDRYGQIRCHINTGIACDRIGRAESAVRSYQLALELGRSSHAPDLAGLASINLGVLHLRGGCYDEARERLEEALRLFTAVGNEPHRLATLYNMAHLARERGDAAAAVELYEATAELARKIGQIDVEIGALAGTGLAGLALGTPELVDTSLREVAARLSTRGDWWFQGRELAEALDVRVALRTAGARAETRFREALALAERNDRYAAAWLLAECAGPLVAVGATAVWETVEEYAREVEALGYASLSRRFAAFRAACR